MQPSETFLTFNQQYSSTNAKFYSTNNTKPKKGRIQIGYYPIRGKAQVCRLLCQYLKIQYEDIFFDPNTWLQFIKQKKEKWLFEQLPFIRDQEFVVTQTLPSCIYLIEKSNNKQLLGKTIADQTKIDMFLWSSEILTNVIAMACKSPCQGKSPEQYKNCIWQKYFQPRFQSYELQAKQNNWYVGYLTLIDFFIYEMVHYVSAIFPNKINKFPKIMAIEKKFGQIPAIYSYQSSNKKVSDCCPMRFFEKFKSNLKCVFKSQQN